MVILSVSVAILVVALSPLALQALSSRNVDWIRLSAVGESYGGISAILAAAALVGVALAVGLQVRQVRDARRLALRQMHLELLRMSIDNPRLAPAWGAFRTPPGIDVQLVMYLNLILNYFVLLVDLDLAESDEINMHIKSLAQSELTRAYWREVHEIWRAAYARGKAGKLIDMIDREMRVAEPGTAPS